MINCYGLTGPASIRCRDAIFELDQLPTDLSQPVEIRFIDTVIRGYLFDVEIFDSSVIAAIRPVS